MVFLLTLEQRVLDAQDRCRDQVPPVSDSGIGGFGVTASPAQETGRVSVPEPRVAFTVGLNEMFRRVHGNERSEVGLVGKDAEHRGR